MANLGVIGLYDTHPINEFEILAKLEAKGADLDALTQDDLGEFRPGQLWRVRRG